ASALLELQPGFPGRLRERLDPAVVLVPASVEHDGLDPLLPEALRDRRADRLRGGHVPALSGLLAHVLVERRGLGDRRACRVVDRLGVDVLVAAEDREAGPRGHPREPSPDPMADPAPNRDPIDRLLHRVLPPYFAPVLPAFLRTISSAYFTPLAL